MSIASRTLRRPGVAACCISALLGAWAVAFAQPAPEEFSDRVISLPEVVVSDTRELPRPESWEYARLPGLEVLSSASAAETRRLVADLQEFQQVLDVVWPMPHRANARLLLILCGRSGEFDSFCPVGRNDDPSVGRASLHLTGPRQSAIVVDVKTRVLNVDVLDSNPTGSDTSQLRVDQTQQLRREYMRYLLSGADVRFPAWFEEGMAQVAMNIKHDGRSIAVGKLEQANAISAEAALYAQDQEIAAMQAHGGSNRMVPGTERGAGTGFAPPPAEERDFNTALATRAVLPMERFLTVPHGAPETLQPLGANVWMKQAYAFVHLGLFGENGKWRKPFAEFLRRSTREPVSEALFKECFKKSYRDMEMEMKGYADFTAYRAIVFKAKDGAGLPKPAPIELRDATASEVGCIKAAAKQLAGNVPGARLEVIAPYARGERDPRLLAALGRIEHESGKDGRARKFLQAAVAAKCDDPEACLQLARFLYADADATPGVAAQRQFSAKQIAEISRPLLMARTLDPTLLGIYEVLADTLSRSSVPLQERDVLPLIQGAQLFPKHFRLIYQTAGLCASAGLTKVASTFTDHGIKYAPDADTRAQFEQLKTHLPTSP